MAPVATRRSQVRKKKAATIQQGSVNGYIATHIIRESKQIPKATCFFDESLLACDICLEVMHNAMNVSPCNHKFCAGCIYEWNSLNKKCPKCRWSAADITRDTTLNSIIEQYLIAFPEKRRDAAQLIELDERELDHLEKWERKRGTNEEGAEYDMGDEYFESEDSDDFEPEDEQLEEDAEDGSVFVIASSERDEYLSRRNLEKARMERLRREKEERQRLKEIEERSRRTDVTSKKGKRRGLRCSTLTAGRNGSRSSSSRRSLPNPSTRSVVTRSMSRRS